MDSFGASLIKADPPAGRAMAPSSDGLNPPAGIYIVVFFRKFDLPEGRGMIPPSENLTHVLQGKPWCLPQEFRPSCRARYGSFITKSALLLQGEIWCLLQDVLLSAGIAFVPSSGSQTNRFQGELWFLPQEV